MDAKNRARVRLFLFLLLWIPLSVLGLRSYLFLAFFFFGPPSVQWAALGLGWGWSSVVFGAWAWLGWRYRPEHALLQDLQLAMVPSLLLLGLLGGSLVMGTHIALALQLCLLGSALAVLVWRGGPLGAAGNRFCGLWVACCGLLGLVLSGLSASRLDWCLPPHLLHFRFVHYDPVGIDAQEILMFGGPVRANWAATCMQLPESTPVGVRTYSVGIATLREPPSLEIARSWERVEGDEWRGEVEHTWLVQDLDGLPAVSMQESRTWF